MTRTSLFASRKSRIASSSPVSFRTDNGSVGFFGPIRGPRTGREYTITVKVPARSYPEMEPAVYIYPRIGLEHWQWDEVNHNPTVG